VLQAGEQLEGFRNEVGSSDRPFTIYVRLSRPGPELVATFQAEGFVEFNVGATELFPRGEVATMTLYDKLAVLDRVAAELGLSKAA